MWRTRTGIPGMNSKAAFLVLVPGPVFGIWAMARLRAHPDALKLAGGRR